MKAYSVDLREKVLRAVDQGYPRGEIVKLLGVSRATIKRYLRAATRDREVAPKAIAGRPPKKLGALSAELVEQLRAHDDVSLAEHCRLWEQSHGLTVSRSTMTEAMKRLGWTRKKSRWVPSPYREDERARWREQMKQGDAKRLVVVDECGSNIALTPLYARAPKGQRAHGSVPRTQGKNITLLAGLSLSGIEASMVIEGGRQRTDL